MERCLVVPVRPPMGSMTAARALQAECVRAPGRRPLAPRCTLSSPGADRERELRKNNLIWFSSVALKPKDESGRWVSDFVLR
jgi:hypothetical protein